MKSVYIVIIVLLVVGGFFWWNQDNKVEAPAPEQNEEVGAISDTMPVPGTAGVNEMVVEEAAEPAAVKEFTVIGKKFSFSPATLTVQKGDKVKITFQNTDGFHDFKIDEYGVATAQQQSPAEAVVEFTADKAGSFAYYCSVGEHRALGMVGTLVVEE